MVTRRELSPKSGGQTVETLARRAGHGNLGLILTLGNQGSLGDNSAEPRAVGSQFALGADEAV
jgi:hypothetical protein